MATFVLNSVTKIGAFKAFRGLSEVVIKKSIRNFNDTAIVKLPTTAVMKRGEAAQSQSVLTAQQFKRGDKINIQLGYNGKLREEFEGFIARVNKSTPCELECEGYAFQLRHKQVNKSWKGTSIREVLKEIVSGTDIILSSDIEDSKLDVVQLGKQSAFDALAAFQKQMGGVIAIYFDKNVLYAGLAFAQLSEKNKQAKADVYYKIGYNIVRDGKLKERMAGDAPYEFEFIHKAADGKKNIVKVGLPNSNAQRKKVQAVKDQDLLQRMAREAEQSKDYTGFDGKLTGFLQPYCKPSQKVKIEDPKYPERGGSFLIESTEVKYGTGGARRSVELSIKL